MIFITMEEKPPLKIMMFVNLVILLCFLAINVDSQQQKNVSLSPPPSPLPKSPPSPSFRPPPSPLPKSPPSPSFRPPPSPQMLRPPPPPPIFSPPPPPPPTRHSPPPPPPKLHSSPTKFPHDLDTNSQLNQHKTHTNKHRSSSLNPGQKIGLLFAGIVVILQIGVVGFLAFKRRQLLKTRD